MNNHIEVLSRMAEERCPILGTWPTSSRAARWALGEITRYECERAALDHLLASKHTGMRISASGVLGRIRDGLYYRELNFVCGEMLRHLEELAIRFYSGDVKAVDEFLQLYDIDAQRPETKP